MEAFYHPLANIGTLAIIGFTVLSTYCTIIDRRRR